MQHVVVVIPIYANIEKAKDVAQEYEEKWLECIKLNTVRHFYFKRHDDNSQHAVTESVGKVDGTYGFSKQAVFFRGYSRWERRILGMRAFANI
jgi:hypothetical protein